MALSADLYNIKSSGAYTYIIDKSQIDIRMENRMMPLVVGYSDKGVRRMPVVITSKSQFNRVFGTENNKEYDKGNYFRKMAYDLLKNGRFIYAMNLAPINENLLDLFNTDNGFTPNYGYECEEGEEKFSKIYNSNKPTHVFIFENTQNNAMKLNGYDLTVSEYYQSASLNPTSMPIPIEIEDPESKKVYEFYRNVYVFDGYFDDFYLKSLYDSGYNNLIERGVKLQVGKLTVDGNKDKDESKPEYQKIIFYPKSNIDLEKYNIDTDSFNILQGISIQGAKTIEEDGKVKELGEITVCNFEKVGTDVVEIGLANAKEIAALNEVGEVGEWMYFSCYPTFSEPEEKVEKETDETETDGADTPETDEPETVKSLLKFYFKNDGYMLQGKSFNGMVSVVYSNLSSSSDMPAKITFDNTGFKIDTNVPEIPVEYNIIGDDKVKIIGNVEEAKIDGKWNMLDECLSIHMPFGAVINVDNDATETTFTNKSDFLAMGSYSKIEMSVGNEIDLYPNKNTTYITKNGIVVESGSLDSAILKIKSTDLKMVLSYIGTVDTIQIDDTLSNEYVYIKLNSQKTHTFSFTSDTLTPFTIHNLNGNDALVEYKGNRAIANISTYCAPLGKTVVLKVNIAKTGVKDEGTRNKAEIESVSGMSWAEFKEMVDDIEGADAKWCENTYKFVQEKLSFQNAIEDGAPISQTFYLVGGEKTIEAISQIDGSGFVAKYSGFAIPNFIDALGVNQEIKNTFNQDVFLHNCLLGTCNIHMNDSYSNVICDWMESDVYTPLYDMNPIANALIDSELAQKTAYKTIFGKNVDIDTLTLTTTAEMRRVIPTPKDAPSCLHTGKNHKQQYGVGGYDYDYNCLDPETTNANDMILVKCLTENPYLEYRYIVDTIIHNASYLNGYERCNKWVGTAISKETNYDKLKTIIYHHNLFKIVNEYGKATALVNAPYPLKTKKKDTFNAAIDCLPTDMDGNWRGTYTTAYKMMNYDTVNTSLISCQGHIYPSAGRECELCFLKHENHYPYTPVAGPNNGVIVDDYTVTPAETFTKSDRDILEPIGINVLVYKDTVGTYINSNQTAKQRVQSALSKFHIAELLTYMTIEIQKMMIQLQWEMNTPQIREYLKMKVDNFCQMIQNNRGILTYYNICDSSNNTEEVIDNEMIVLDTGIEPSRAIGKMVNRISIYKTGGIKLSGLV